MASNDQNQEQRRQLVETIKNTLELQRNGSIPAIIDPMILDNLTHNDPNEYLETLRKTAMDIRKLLSELSQQKQPIASAHTANETPHGNSHGQKCAVVSESHTLSGASSFSSLGKVVTPNVWVPNEEDEEDLYENTGPGSRVARLSIPENGKLPSSYFICTVLFALRYFDICW